MKKITLILSQILLVVSTQLSQAQDFITVWDMSRLGSSPTSISLKVDFSNPVAYTWKTVPLGQTGAGLITNNTHVIQGLPANTIIELSLNPIYLNEFKVDYAETYRLLDVKQWGSVKWKSMNAAFSDCISLNITATDIPDLSQVKDMKKMFYNCSRLNGPPNINSWNTSNVTNMIGVFNKASVFNQPIGNWNTSKVEYMNEMFNGASAFNQPIGTWNTANVLEMVSMFESAVSFNQPLGSWNTQNVTNMSNMFSGATWFNQPIGTWNTQNVTDMSHLFYLARTFNQPIGSWNTSSVKNMSVMFGYATSFNQTIGGWNTSLVSDMTGMFAWATNFNQPIHNWNTSNVVSFATMFAFANTFNQSVSKWNLSKAVLMNEMFYESKSFNQSLVDWTSKFNFNVNLGFFLDQSGLSLDNYDNFLIALNKTTLSGLNIGALNLKYCSSLAARTNLITNKGWKIDGDTYNPNACIIENPGTVTSPVVASYVGLPVVFGITNNIGGQSYYTIKNNLTGLTVVGLQQANVQNNQFGFTPTVAGSYSITVSLKKPDGTWLTGNTANFTVIAPSISISTTATKTYGQPNPVFSSTIVGLVPEATVSYQTTALPNSPAGTYEVTAIVSGGPVGYAPIIRKGLLTIAPKPLAIVVRPATKVYGMPNPQFQSSITGLVGADVVMVNYSTLATSLTGVGKYAISATVSGTSISNYIPQITSGEFTITPKPLAVVVRSATKVYGSPNPQFQSSITGLVGADVVMVNYSTQATSLSGVGKYAISATVSGASLSNYIPQITSGELTIAPKPLAIFVRPATKVYGSPNPQFQSSITGLVGADVVMVNYSTQATSLFGVGKYAISATVSGTSLSNYIPQIISGELTITPKPLAIVVRPATKVYGSPNPQFQSSITGLVGADKVQVGYISTATQFSNVGIYSITPTISGVVSQNYLPQYAIANLSIIPARLVITINEAQKVYGSPEIPEISGQITSGKIRNDDVSIARFTTSVTQYSFVGEYPISVKLKGSKANNYIANVVGKLKVTPAPLFVYLNSIRTQQGTSNLPFSSKIDGLLGTDQVNITYQSAATTSAAIGIYPITALLSGALAINYAPTYNTAFVYMGSQYEAELAQLSGPVNIATQGGATYVNQLDANGTSINFDNVDVALAGTYKIKIRYANAQGPSQQMAVYTNGTRINNTGLVFLNQSNWDTYAEAEITLYLNEGINSIKLQKDFDINLQQLRIDRISVEAIQDLNQLYFPFQAEEAELSSNLKISNQGSGYAHTGFVTNFQSDGDKLSFNQVFVSTSGEYKIAIKYNNPHGMTQSLAVYVNGVREKSFQMLASGRNDIWDEVMLSINLKAGNNIISIEKDAQMNGGNYSIDYIDIKPRLIENSNNNNLRKEGSIVSEYINENTNIEVHIYPNPFADKLTVDIEALQTDVNYSIKLYDIKGIEVYSKMIYQSNELIIGLPSGAYMAKILKNEKVIKAIKLVRE